MSKVKDHKIDQLTVPELKEELEKRNLPIHGAKAALITRLREAMKSEGYNLDVNEDSDLEMGEKGGEAEEKQEGSSIALMQMLLAIQKPMEKQTTELKADFNKQSSEINKKLDQQSTETAQLRFKQTVNQN